MFNKKDDHVNLAREFHNEKRQSDFDKIKFVHNSLPELDMAKVDISTEIAGFKLEAPFFINAMTGGSHMTKDINKKLAQVAQGAQIPMASGSLSVAIKDKDLEDSFRVIRENNKEGLIFANLGAEHSLENAKKALEIIEGDGLQIHLNAPQELVMPEGDRDFSHWKSSIENLVRDLDLPLIVKEVGFGMSRETIGTLKDMGVKTIDLGGYGGTNFAKIENFRRDKTKYDYLENFGQSTVISLLEAYEYREDLEIIATGGIRNSMDIVKSLALGARAVGLAAPVLNLVLDRGVEETIAILEDWKYEIRMIMTLLGKKNIGELDTTDIIIGQEPKEWCQIRGIDYKYFGNRNKKRIV